MHPWLAHLDQLSSHLGDVAFDPRESRNACPFIIGPQGKLGFLEGGALYEAATSYFFLDGCRCRIWGDVPLSVVQRKRQECAPQLPYNHTMLRDEQYRDEFERL